MLYIGGGLLEFHKRYKLVFEVTTDIISSQLYNQLQFKTQQQIMISSQNKILHHGAADERQKKNEMMKKELETKAGTFVLFLSVNQHVTEDELSTMLQLLFVHQYDDAIRERANSAFCGYPLCPAKLIVKFCGNQCFLSSKHLRKQISADPLIDRIMNVRKFDYLRNQSNFEKSEIIQKPPGDSLADKIKKMSLREHDDHNGDDDYDNDGYRNNYSMNRCDDYNGFDYDDDDEDKLKKILPKRNPELKKKTETRRTVMLQSLFEILGVATNDLSASSSSASNFVNMFDINIDSNNIIVPTITTTIERSDGRRNCYSI
ncbi:hypothetical protein HELRODRAFT_169025 [Helobdella robusta]|uniref:protein-serine/threonine phosphatase n=1 Tax=Helobdella robusta TaxID=6412 RepID=T1F199_HELRO|nr:hypothetical protein HELRODRAFT_169025 [Helobdella robusta]ESO09085.1 hypothetical protein HELRODRAFT_169025 [Helobdella robusta]